jgi:hypothetical protein
LRKAFCNILFFAATAACWSQNTPLKLHGTVYDKEHNKALPYCSIGLKNHALGTVSNEQGQFHFTIPKNIENDTIVVSFIGYSTFLLPLKEIKDTLTVFLQPLAFQLEEVTVYPLSPTDYIKLAVQQAAVNYPTAPFGTLGLYSEKLTENGTFLKGEEAVIKSFYPNYQDTSKNQHQVVLHRGVKDPAELAFMKRQREKKLEKAIKKQDTAAINELDFNLDEVFGGPEMVLALDLMKSKDPFLDSTQFKYFDFRFGKASNYEGRELICIEFSSKKTLEHFKGEGSLLLDSETKAIVVLKNRGHLIIPLWFKPILFAMGLGIQQPEFEKEVHYQLFKSKWYPKNFRWHFSTRLTKRYLFKDNERSFFEIGQGFVINEILPELNTPIPAVKRFRYKKKLSEQVFPEKGIGWPH